MNNIRLANDCIEVSISKKGAELQSLQHQNGIEYVWQANPAYWGKHSPVLFPIVGSLKNNTYFYNGQSYQLPRHGFARDQIFSATVLSDSESVFTLESSPDTLKVYPFPFILQLRYNLSGSSISCTYEVTNPDSKDLLFSIGAHPAFNVPLVSGTQYNDYALQFNVDEPLLRYKLQDGLLSNETVEVPATKGKLPLQHQLFEDDAIVLKNLSSTVVSLICPHHTHGWHFHFEGFPHLGIWASPLAPFVCIEPWFGHADTVHHQQQLTEKEGIICLPGNSGWSHTWRVELF